MNKKNFSIAAGVAIVLAAVLAFAQSGAPAPASPAPKQQKLIRVATINGAQANREFQANVQLVQAQRQAVTELSAALEKEKDARKKQEIKKQLDVVLAKLNENNAAMTKAYGFSLARNYTMEIETAHIYLMLTEEEAAKIEQAQKAEQARKAKSKK